MSSLSPVSAADVVSATATLREGWTRYNAHGHEYDGCTLTNRTGGGLVAGDVVAVSTANDLSVILADAQRSTRHFVTAAATIADTDAGEFARSGVVTVRSQGAIVRGHYLVKSATSKAVEDSGIASTFLRPAWALGVAMSASAGGASTIVAMLFDARDVPGGVTPVAIEKLATQITGTTNETTLYSRTVPGRWLSDTGILRLRLILTVAAAGSGAHTLKIKYGGTTAISRNTVFSTGGQRNIITIYLCAEGVSSQYVFTDHHDSGQGFPRRGTAAEDSTVDQTLAVTVTPADAGMDITLVSAFSEFMRRP